MATVFDPSKLSPSDQQAYLQWKQAVQAHGTPTALEGYLIQHPDRAATVNDGVTGGYSPQEIQQAQQTADLLSGRTLPPAVRQQLANYHVNTDTAQMERNKGLWSLPETYIQIALGAGLGGVAAGGIAAGAGGGSIATPATAAPLAEAAAPAAGAFGASGVPTALGSELASTTIPTAGSLVSGAAPSGNVAAATGGTTAGGGLTQAAVKEGLQQAGGMLSRGAQGSAEERLAEAQTNAGIYRTAIDAAINGPAQLAKQARWAAVGNALQKPTAPAWIASQTPSGVFGTGQGQPSDYVLPPDARKANDELYKQAILNLMNAPKTMPVPTAPQPTKAGTGEKIAAGAGIGLNLASQVPWSRVLSYV